MIELLTVDEVARECRIHPVTVRRHIASGRLRAVHLGRSVRVRRDDLNAFVNQVGASLPERTKNGAISVDDPIWKLVGSYSDPEWAGFSTNKRKFLGKLHLPSE